MHQLSEQSQFAAIDNMAGSLREFSHISRFVAGTSKVSLEQKFTTGTGMSSASESKTCFVRT